MCYGEHNSSSLKVGKWEEVHLKCWQGSFPVSMIVWDYCLQISLRYHRKCSHCQFSLNPCSSLNSSQSSDSLSVKWNGLRSLKGNLTYSRIQITVSGFSATSGVRAVTELILSLPLSSPRIHYSLMLRLGRGVFGSPVPQQNKKSGPSKLGPTMRTY